MMPCTRTITVWKRPRMHLSLSVVQITKLPYNRSRRWTEMLRSEDSAQHDQ